MTPYIPSQDLATRPPYRGYGIQSARGIQQIPTPEQPRQDKPADDSIGVIEYLQIIRRHRGTVILFAFLGLLLAVLYTMPQTPLYRARTVIEIQNINNDFMNMRSVSPVAEDNTSNVLTDVQTQMKIIQSENLIDRVIQKLKSEGKIKALKATSRFAPIKKLLNLPESKGDDPDYTLEQLAMRSLTVHQMGQTPEICGRFCEHADQRVRGQQHGSALEDERTHRTVAQQPVGRYADQAGTVGERIAAVRGTFRSAVHNSGIGQCREDECVGRQAAPVAGSVVAGGI